MEFLLFALFFIVTLIFFIAGKDDFGRKENKLKVQDIESLTKEEESETKDEIKKEEESETKDEIKNEEELKSE